MPVRLSNPLNRKHPLLRQLAAWWMPLPGLDGGYRLYDIADAGLHATLTNGAAWSVQHPGGFGSVLLDGSDDYLTTPSGLPSYSSGNYSATWNLWVTLISAGNFPMGITQGSTSVLWLGNGSNRTPVLHSAFSSGGVSFGTALTLGVPYMLTGTMTRFSDNTTTCYINGEQVASAAGYATINVSSPQFGRRDDGFYANARFGSIQYWFGPENSAVLSAAQVRELYDESRAGYPKLLNWYRPRAWDIAEDVEPPDDDTGVGRLEYTLPRSTLEFTVPYNPLEYTLPKTVGEYAIPEP